MTQKTILSDQNDDLIPGHKSTMNDVYAWFGDDVRKMLHAASIQIYLYDDPEMVKKYPKGFTNGSYLFLNHQVVDKIDPEVSADKIPSKKSYIDALEGVLSAMGDGGRDAGFAIVDEKGLVQLFGEYPDSLASIGLDGPQGCEAARRWRESAPALVENAMGRADAVVQEFVKDKEYDLVAHDEAFTQPSLLSQVAISFALGRVLGQKMDDQDFILRAGKVLSSFDTRAYSMAYRGIRDVLGRSVTADEKIKLAVGLSKNDLFTRNGMDAMTRVFSGMSAGYAWYNVKGTPFEKEIFGLNENGSSPAQNSNESHAGMAKKKSSP